MPIPEKMLDDRSAACVLAEDQILALVGRPLWSRRHPGTVDAPNPARREIMSREMTDSHCPYLTCEKSTFRESLDLTEPDSMRIVLTWYCEHPFHGVALELGDARLAMERRCAACSLPRPEPESDTD